MKIILALLYALQALLIGLTILIAAVVLLAAFWAVGRLLVGVGLWAGVVLLRGRAEYYDTAGRPIVPVQTRGRWLLFCYPAEVECDFPAECRRKVWRARLATIFGKRRFFEETR